MRCETAFQCIAWNETPQPVTVLYCDTGVEIPLVRTYVWQTLTGLSIESKNHDIDLTFHIAVPKLKDRFFFKVIGRGYVPPTNKFRWCTDRLRIQPVQSYVKQLPGTKKVVVLGLREGESHDRDKRIGRHKTENPNWLRQSGLQRTTIYSPILRYAIEDVWNVLATSLPPTSIDSRRLLKLYRHANGECPIVRHPKSSPCAGSRFGCWTCTVVRRDHAMEGLVEAGYDALRPLLDFRNWLHQFRDEHEERWVRRRNGAVGPGPFKLSARRTILQKLLAAERLVGFPLIGHDEIEAIKTEWKSDRRIEEEISHRVTDSFI